MRIFIAGPMRGLPEYNFPEFYRAEEVVRRYGHDAVNPARLDEEDGFDPHCDYRDEEMAELVKSFVARNITQLVGCDAIALLPGWEDSEGAKLEVAVAQYLGLDILRVNSGARALVGVQLRPTII